MVKEYIIALNAERTAPSKFDYSVQCVLRFCYDFANNEFFFPRLIVKKGSKFGEPQSPLVKKGAIAAHLVKKGDAMVLLEDYLVTDKSDLSQTLNTVFSLYVSKSLTFKSQSGSLTIGFLWSLFKAKRQKDWGGSLNVNEERKINIHDQVTESLDDPEFPNLAKLAHWQWSNVTLPKKEEVNKEYLKKYTKIELINCLIDHLFFNQKQNKKQQIKISSAANVMSENKSKDIVENFWKLSFEDSAALMMGQDQEKIRNEAESLIENKASPASAEKFTESPLKTRIYKAEKHYAASDDYQKSDLLAMIKNDSDSSLFARLSEKFNGGSFVGTTGYLSVPLLAEMLSDLDEKITSFKLGIGKINPNRNGSVFTSQPEFNLDEESTYPKYEIFKKIGETWSKIDDTKYEFFTTEENLLHAKSYLCSNELIIGSSNLTYSGAKTGNLELSLLINQKKLIREYLSWFETAKEKSTDIKAVLKQALEQTYMVSPIEVVLDKINNALLPPELEGTTTKNFENEPIFKELLSYQKEAFKQIIDGLGKNNIFMLADDVGLGKTFVTMAVMRYYINAGATIPAVIASKSLIKKIWEPIKKGDYPKSHGPYGLELIQNNWFSLDSEKITKKQMENHMLFVIDESHFFRNFENNKKTKRAREILESAVEKGAKILLLTATPIHNGFEDLMNQFGLGKRDSDSRYVDNFLNNLDGTKMRGKIASDPLVYQWIKERFTTRSKKFVRENYEDAKAFIPEDPEYKGKIILEKEDAVIEKIIQMLDKVVSDALSYCAIVKYMLLKQLESSERSFSKSLEKFVENAKNGNHAKIKELVQENMDDFSEDFYESNLQEIGKNPGEFSAVDEKAYLLLKEYLGQNDMFEAKARKLDDIIYSDLKSGILVFTGSQHTSEALFERYKKQGVRCGFANGQFARSYNPIFEDTSIDPRKGEEILYLFSPLTQSAPQELKNKIEERKFSLDQVKLDVLIVTDKYSEGVNLQENLILVNYDIPWTPVVMQQRIGRLDRIRPKETHWSNKPVDIYTFMPSKSLETKLKLIEKVMRKYRISNTMTDRQSPITGNWDTEEEVLDFIDAKRGKKYMEELHLQFQAAPARSINWQRNLKNHGWFTAIRGDENQLYNLIKVGKDYHLVSGINDISKDNQKNLRELNNILRNSKAKILEKSDHDLEIKYGGYSRFDEALHKQIRSLSSETYPEKKIDAKIVATVFVIKEEK